MKYFSLLSVVALTFASCLEDQRPTELIFTPRPFSAQELEVLNVRLDADLLQQQTQATIPQHIAAGISNPQVDPAKEVGDRNKAMLGRVLFYDTRLSATGETSCATCHKQELAFSDDVAFSKGINGGKTKRNSIALASVPTFATEISGYGESVSVESDAFTQGSVAFFWDERASTIKHQSTLTIEDRVEMGRDLEELAEDLRRDEMYRILTRKAYGTEELTADRLTFALEKFCASIRSMDSPFDDLMDASFGLSQSVTMDEFTEEEQLGHSLFLTNCSTCHGANMTQPFVPTASNGLDERPDDLGVGEHRGAAENGVFKVPFLRNVALTAPYMHDGRFRTLREVIDHYSSGIQNHENLHPALRDFNTGLPLRMNFTEAEKDALIAFLQLTTDRSVTHDPSLADPFLR